jgi:hypothetical protein
VPGIAKRLPELGNGAVDGHPVAQFGPTHLAFVAQYIRYIARLAESAVSSQRLGIESAVGSKLDEGGFGRNGGLDRGQRYRLRLGPELGVCDG